jgi:hypothetical protein
LKTRLLAFGLTFLIGILVTVAFTFIIVGPLFGSFLAARLGFSRNFALLWPLLRHVLGAIVIVPAIS